MSQIHIIYRLTTWRHIADRHNIHALLHSLFQLSFLYSQSKPCVNFTHHSAAICCTSCITFSMLNCPLQHERITHNVYKTLPQTWQPGNDVAGSESVGSRILLGVRYAVKMEALCGHHFEASVPVSCSVSY